MVGGGAATRASADEVEGRHFFALSLRLFCSSLNLSSFFSPSNCCCLPSSCIKPGANMGNMEKCREARFRTLCIFHSKMDTFFFEEDELCILLWCFQLYVCPTARILITYFSSLIALHINDWKICGQGMWDWAHMVGCRIFVSVQRTAKV